MENHTNNIDSQFHSEEATPHSNPSFVGGAIKKGSKVYNEDYKVFWKHSNILLGEVVVSGVFDGHGGYNGMLISAYCGNSLITSLDTNKDSCLSWPIDKWCSYLQTLFPLMHDSSRELLVSSSPNRFIDGKGVVRTVSGDPVHGGTTATIIVLLTGADGKRTVISANVGDSTAMLISSRLPNGYKFLSKDHSPDEEEEWKRIKDLDEKIYPEKLLCVYDKSNVYRKFQCPLVFDTSGVKVPIYVTDPWGNGLHPSNVRYEAAVYAVTSGNVERDTTCIAMTRSIGDFYAHQFGLSCEATITVDELDGGESFIATGSDGIWDTWKWKEFATALTTTFEQKSTGKVVDDSLLEEVAETMVTSSYTMFAENFGAKHIDDLSLVVTKVPSANVAKADASTP